MRANGILARSRWEVTLSPLQLRIASAGFWSLAGALVSKCLALLVSIIVARALGSVVFGELGMIQSTAGVFAVLGSFGLGETGTKQVAELRHRDPAGAGRVIGLSTLVGLLSGAFAAVLLALFSYRVASMLAAPHLGTLLAFSSLLLLLGSLTAVQTGALTGFEAFRELAWIRTLVAILSFPLVIYGAYYGGLWGCVGALIVAAAIDYLLGFRAVRAEAVRQKIRICYRSLRNELPILWRFSLPAVLTGAVVAPTYWACNAIVVQQPNGYAELGVFNAAAAWRSAILFLPSLLGPLLLPFSSSLLSEGRADQSKQLFQTGLLLNIGLAAAVAVPVAVFADTIMSIYGQQFAAGTRVLVLLAILGVVTAATGAIWHTLMGWGSVWPPLVVSVLWAVAMIGFTWLFRDLGGEGLAWSSLFAHALQLAGYLACVLLLLSKPKLGQEHRKRT